LVLVTWTFIGCSEADGPVLVGRAELPPDTFVDGPVSGQFVEAANGRMPPFRRGQPVQGFSAIMTQDDGSFLVLPDNGYGSRENSADYILRVFRIRPSLLTGEQSEGDGSIEYRSEFVLRDPDEHIAWPIVADRSVYPQSDIEVDERIRAGRLLTGADFDVESFRRVEDGSFYFGDEFGPFLLHTDNTGRLLGPPIELPGVWSPQHPQLGNREANLPRSAGFEGMAIDATGRYLYPMLEKPMTGDEGVVRIYQFDTELGAYTHTHPDSVSFWYPLAPGASYATDFTLTSGSRYLVIERDGGQGPTAEFKRIFEVDLDNPGHRGHLLKSEVVDLLDIEDPHGLGTQKDDRFSFPYETTEAVDLLEDGSLVIVNDNNYPFGQGRYWKEGEPDGTELIVVRPARDLKR
jgi:hypothetical protein